MHFFITTKSNSEVKFELHYFEANHGTAAGADIGWCRYWDAIHGHVLSNKAIIKSSNKFTGHVESILKINVLYLDEND